MGERVCTTVCPPVSFFSRSLFFTRPPLASSDFSGENAQTWFRNIDKLIHHVNANGPFNALYSTPSIYTSAKLAGTQLPQRDEDVMPYFDDA